jgi:Holliday junction resolvase RusA-like endonuclease
VNLLDITVMGDPIPKGRPRSGAGRHYTPDRTVMAEQLVWSAMTNALRGRRPYEGPVGLDVTFWCATRRRTDGDNLLKLITDALQRGRRPVGGLILDDAQIEDWHCRIHRGAAGEQPRSHIRVWTLEPAG